MPPDVEGKLECPGRVGRLQDRTLNQVPTSSPEFNAHQSLAIVTLTAVLKDPDNGMPGSCLRQAGDLHTLVENVTTQCLLLTRICPGVDTYHYVGRY